MKPICIAAVILVVALKFAIGPMFVSLPAVSVAGSSALVGPAEGDHARYQIANSREIYATNIGYSFNNDPKELAKIGSRGMISYVDPRTYDSAIDWHCKTGQCFGSILDTSAIRTLFLIPQNEATMTQMRTIGLDSGQRFILSGHDMSLTEAVIGGQPMNFTVNGAGYFLVDSIRAE